MEILLNRTTAIAEMLLLDGIECEVVGAFRKKSSAELLNDRKERLAYLRTPAGQAVLRKARLFAKIRRRLHKRPDAERSRMMKQVHRAYS